MRVDSRKDDKSGFIKYVYKEEPAKLGREEENVLMINWKDSLNGYKSIILDKSEVWWRYVKRTRVETINLALEKNIKDGN